MTERFSLKDHLFNPQTVGQLAAEFAAGVAGFDADQFTAQALAGFPERELMARMDWMADCLEGQLAAGFPAMAAQLQAALPPRLDPDKTDDDFGHFIHGVHGILIVRHGLEHHRARAMELIHEATQRFTMEFYIRAFLNRWPNETLAQLAIWAGDDNYHVRRLVSEGTRPRLPWAQNVGLAPAQSFPLLDILHSDRARFVTRSVANHLNDLSKTFPDQVLERLSSWKSDGHQDPKELDWMTRHALRTLVKQGHAGAMAAMGYSTDAQIEAVLKLARDSLKLGEALAFEVRLCSAVDTPVLVDYRIGFARPSGKMAEKVFKLKTATLCAGKPLTLAKTHKLKAGASTFTLHAGAHRLTVQVNGRDVAQLAFDLTD